MDDVIIVGAGIGGLTLGLALQSLASTVFTAVMTLLTGTAGILAGVGVTTEGNDGVTRADSASAIYLEAAAGVTTFEWSSWVSGSMLQSAHSPDPSALAGSSRSLVAAG